MSFKAASLGKRLMSGKQEEAWARLVFFPSRPCVCLELLSLVGKAAVRAPGGKVYKRGRPTFWSDPFYSLKMTSTGDLCEQRRLVSCRKQGPSSSPGFVY